MKKLIMIVGVIIVLSACSGTGDKIEKGTETKSEVYASFQNIDIQQEENEVIIMGEANASGDSFYYLVEVGEEVVIAEEKVTVDGEWGDFILNIDLTTGMKDAETVTIVKMYTKGRDGNIVNPNYIPLDVQNQTSG